MADILRHTTNGLRYYRCPPTMQIIGHAYGGGDRRFCVVAFVCDYLMGYETIVAYITHGGGRLKYRRFWLR